VIAKNMNRREGEKEEASHILIAFAIETLCSWGKEAQKFVQSLRKDVQNKMPKCQMKWWIF